MPVPRVFLDDDVSRVVDNLESHTARLRDSTQRTWDGGSDPCRVEVARQLLVTAGDKADRLRNEAAFAMLCGVSPPPASSGKTQRHRLM
jgi:hypothetical protein